MSSQDLPKIERKTSQVNVPVTPSTRARLDAKARESRWSAAEAARYYMELGFEAEDEARGQAA